jgi:hypothetical protein
LLQGLIIGVSLAKKTRGIFTYGAVLEISARKELNVGPRIGSSARILRLSNELA